MIRPTPRTAPRARRVAAVLVCATAVLVMAPAALAHPHGNWGSVYRSIDGGRIWSDLNATRPVTTVHDLSVPHPPRVWAATDDGLLRTDALGRGWTSVGPRALGDVTTVVDEDPEDGSVLVGSENGLFHAEADLATWQRVLEPTAGRPVALHRDGVAITVQTATDGWYRSDDGGITFSPAEDAYAAIEAALPAPPEGVDPALVLSTAVLAGTTVAGTTVGAFADAGDGTWEPVDGTQGLAVWSVHAGPRSDVDGLLLATGGGLLLHDPRGAGGVVPVPDIPPTLPVGVIETSAERPDELYMASSRVPYVREAQPAGTAPVAATASAKPAGTAGTVAVLVGGLAVTAALFALAAVALGSATVRRRLERIDRPVASRH